MGFNFRFSWEFFFVALCLSIGGWVAVLKGIVDVRKADRRRRRTTGTVVEIATRTERRKHRVNRPQQHRVYEYMITQYYPVVVFSAEGKVYRLECPHTCLKHELSVGETVDILYEDDHPQRFQIDRVLHAYSVPKATRVRSFSRTPPEF